MSKIAITGAATGTATFTIESPATSTNRTLTLPDATGTVVASGTTPSLNGITFPATQVASADANTLDDYEEGTWTPADGSGAGLTFTGFSGRCFYTKIGRLVIASFQVTYPSTADGNTASVGGLPFTSNSNAGGNSTQAVCFSQNNFANGVMGIVNQNASSFIFIVAVPLAAQTNSQVSGKDFRGTAIYQTS